MIGIRHVRPIAQNVSSHNLRFQIRLINKISPHLTHRCAFRTSTCNFNQVTKPSNDKKTALLRAARVEPDIKHVTHDSKLKLSNEIYTIPNLLTLSRIAATPFIGYFLATGQTTPAIAVFTYSCVSDFLDGYIARKYEMKSALGSILDPAADKFLMTTCTVALATSGSIPLYVASTIIGRDVLLSLTAFYLRYASFPPPVTMKRYFDMSIITHTVHPNLLGKANTVLQMLYIGGSVLKPAIESFCILDLSVTFDFFGMCVAATTACSGLSYIIGKYSFRSI